MHLFSENKKRNDFGDIFYSSCVCVWGGGGGGGEREVERERENCGYNECRNSQCHILLSLRLLL